ncbi:hypothetical protein BC832DRAFT_563379 [Gaertneriomyces semiglobifer]|nr:hypothetical protein BC832DRAFT_563379 [Gaertneriomyces semiglobifer]
MTSRLASLWASPLRKMWIFLDRNSVKDMVVVLWLGGQFLSLSLSFAFDSLLQNVAKRSMETVLSHTHCVSKFQNTDTQSTPHTRGTPSLTQLSFSSKIGYPADKQVKATSPKKSTESQFRGELFHLNSSLLIHSFIHAPPPVCWSH